MGWSFFDVFAAVIGVGEGGGDCGVATLSVLLSGMFLEFIQHQILLTTSNMIHVFV